MKNDKPKPPPALYVVPRKGFKVHYPCSTNQVPDAGAHVPNTAYWRKMIACEDVAVAQAPDPTKTQKAKE